MAENSLVRLWLKSTGEPLMVWPVDVGDLLMSGEYVSVNPHATPAEPEAMASTEPPVEPPVTGRRTR